MGVWVVGDEAYEWDMAAVDAEFVVPLRPSAMVSERVVMAGG
jgi:hypothetical protein